MVFRLFVNNRNEKNKSKNEKPSVSVYLEISKTLMYEFWYDYVKPKHQDNAKLCDMDTDSFIINIKTEDFYEEIANDVEKRFDTSNYEVIDHYLQERINK